MATRVREKTMPLALTRPWTAPVSVEGGREGSPHPDFHSSPSTTLLSELRWSCDRSLRCRSYVHQVQAEWCLHKRLTNNGVQYLGAHTGQAVHTDSNDLYSLCQWQSTLISPIFDQLYTLINRYKIMSRLRVFLHLCVSTPDVRELGKSHFKS